MPALFLFLYSDLLFRLLPSARHKSLLPVELYSQIVPPFNAWETQRQQNEEKVREPKSGSDREREFPVWVKQ